MAKIAVFTERYTLRSSAEMSALIHFRHAAFELGHQLDFLFRNEIKYLENYEAVLIRALTDPLNTSYVVARLAQMMGLRVIDDPESIRICCDKVNMYQHLLKKQVSMPRTIFLDREELCLTKGNELLALLGAPVVLKAPNSCFSHYVEKVSTAEEFLTVGKRFLRRADRLIAQQYTPSEFDWRVITLNERVLAVVKYVFAPHTWRIADQSEQGEGLKVIGVPREKADPQLLKTALLAGASIGRGLYGIDLKETSEGYVVIEVNDNPNIDAGYEDQHCPGIYREIIRYLAGENLDAETIIS